MKIIYLTDIHDGLSGLKSVLQNTEADLYLLSGDIIYKAFYSFDRIIDFCTSQEELDKLAKEGGDDRTPYDFATHVIRFPKKYSEEVQFICGQYRYLFSIAAKTMKEKYDLIFKLVKKYAKSRCIFLPGNYDIDLQYTELYEYDIHRKSFKIDDLKFSGYGGAPIVTSGIPEKLSVKFHEYTKNGSTFSEPEDFFRDEMPDIAVVHNPAYGYLDKIPGYGNVGSQGIRRYLDDNSPSLVVSGHVHEDQGIIKKKSTVFLNPSNFGSVDSVYGFQEGGFFAEIFIDGKIVKQINLMRLRGTEFACLLKVDTTNEISCLYENPNSDVKAEDFLRK
jgi:Icc-related predicted phosphoesterase